jgi:ABC-type spermidine/putrescine transport system permease subunit II
MGSEAMNLSSFTNSSSTCFTQGNTASCFPVVHSTSMKMPAITPEIAIGFAVVIVVVMLAIRHTMSYSGGGKPHDH